jgi:hypothetical protein
MTVLGGRLRPMTLVLYHKTKNKATPISVKKHFLSSLPIFGREVLVFCVKRGAEKGDKRRKKQGHSCEKVTLFDFSQFAYRKSGKAPRTR